MIKIICIISCEVSEGLQEFLAKLDDENKEIHIYSNMKEKKNLPKEILKLVENLNYQENSDFWFLSNDKALTMLIYRIFNQIFHRFLLYPEENSYQYESPYKEIMVQKICPEEFLSKFIEIYPTMVNFDRADYQKRSCLYNTQEIEIIKNIWSKYYKINEKIYCLEPLCGEVTRIFYEKTGKLSFKNFYYLFEHGVIMKQNIEIISETAYKGFYYQNVDQVKNFLDELVRIVEPRGYLHIQLLCRMFADLCSCLSYEASRFKIFIYSFLVFRLHAYQFIGFIVEEAMNGSCHIYQQLFLWNQLKRIGFMFPDCKNNGEHEILYQNVLKQFRNRIQVDLSPIPSADRFKNVILVLTIQFLSPKHAPTRTALERIYTLGKEMGKTVKIINTREQYSLLGYLPLYNFFNRNISKELDKKKEYTYKDYTASFYQIPVEMPELSKVEEVLEQIREMRPYLVFVIGNGSIVGDLCADMIPTICIPAIFSSVPRKENQYVCIGKQLGKEEKNNLIRERGYSPETIIESVFTFELKEQLTKLTREQLNLPKDKFLLAVVGLRLDTELNIEFFNYLQQTFAFGTHIVLIGQLDNYNHFCESCPELREHSTALGTQNDVLAIIELCDLYINPYRSGGGFSLAEAFSKGVPGVTINHGDVAAAAGIEFCVETYEEMVDKIKQYIEDKEFYFKMSEKAKSRAAILTDSKIAMEGIVEKAVTGSLFF